MFYSPLVRIGCGQGGIILSGRNRIFYSALLLTGVNLLLRFVGTSFQVYLSGRIGAAGIGLLQLVMSVGGLAMVAGIGGIRTATMYLTAEELGKKRPQNVTWVLSACFLYSVLFSGTVAFLLYRFAPWIAQSWIGDERTLPALRLYAAFLPVVCLCGVMTGYFTAANRIGTLAAVEVAEQLCSMALTISLLTLWAGHDPVRACLCVILGSSLGACLTMICLVILRLKEHPSKGPRILVRSRLMETALPLAVADDLKSGITTAENLMVPKRLALNTAVDSPLAAFGLVSGMVFPVVMFPAAILFGLTELLIPELARCSAAGSQTRIHYLMHKGLRVAMIYGIFFGGLLFLISERLCLALYGSTEAAGFLRAYSLLIPMLYSDILTDAMTKGLGQQKICVRYNILTSFLDVVFLYLLLPGYGMVGYYVSFLITHLLNFMLSLRRLLKITNQSIPFHTPALAISAMLFAVWAAAHVSNTIIGGICYGLILFSLLFLFKILNREDLYWIRGLITKKDLTVR